MLEQKNLNRCMTMSQGHAINCIMEQRTYIQLETANLSLFRIFHLGN